MQDYENKSEAPPRLRRFHDRAIGRFREGMAAGVFETKLTIRNVIDQLDIQLADEPEDSPFYGPSRISPRGILRGRQGAAARRLLASIRDEHLPGLRRLRDFLRDEYLPKARDGVGLVHMKGGDRSTSG